MNPANDQALLEKATIAFQAGRFDDAAQVFRDLIARHPDVAELHINLGAALRGTGDLQGAETAYRDAVRLAPQSPTAQFNLGNLLRETGRGEEALRAYRKADSLQPGTPEILNNLGVQLYDSGAVEDALRQYETALAIRPDFVDAIANKGNALQRLTRMNEARDALETALRAAPDNPVFRLNMSAFLAAGGEHADALAWADKALAADPEYVEAKLKRASLLIQQGDLSRGFAAYEARFEKPGWHALAGRLPMPVWQGEALAGKRILVWNEQGFGDALMYARFLPNLRDMGADVFVMCEPALHRLLGKSFDDLHLHPLDGGPPDADYHISIMSLAHRLAVNMEQLSGGTPYLFADRDDRNRWADAIRRHADGRRAVGLIWAGNPGQAHDYARSISPETVRPLLETPGCAFFNLLVGPRGNLLVHPNLIDLRDELSDFAETAALMAGLDLVISVDSAPAHLAGALGVPVWIALAYDPDSRYFLGRNDCPWYPSARLFRQPAPGDWTSPLADIGKALADSPSQ